MCWCTPSIRTPYCGKVTCHPDHLPPKQKESVKDDELNKARLKKDLIHACQQFNCYAELSPIDRSNAVVSILKEILLESLKHQLEESLLDSRADYYNNQT